MSLLAASFALLLDGRLEQTGQLVRRDQQLYSSISRSILVIQDGTQERVSALIGGRMVVTHVAGTPSNFVSARLQNGQSLKLTYVARDPNSQLTAYMANEDLPDSLVPIRVTDHVPTPGSTVLAVLTNSAISSTIARTDGFGILNGTRRMIPLYEVRFEASPELVGGALVFTTTGQLVSAVSAALRPPQSNNGVKNIQDIVNQARQSAQNRGQALTYGPAGQAIAYVPCIELTRRVIDGFLSPSHEVVHPALGVFCVDNIGSGALIQRISPGSSAEKIGIRTGDIILQIGNARIRNQIDFARVMFFQKVGSKVTLMLTSGNRTRVIDVVVGKQTD